MNSGTRLLLKPLNWEKAESEAKKAVLNLTICKMNFKWWILNQGSWWRQIGVGDFQLVEKSNWVTRENWLYELGHLTALLISVIRISVIQIPVIWITIIQILLFRSGWLKIGWQSFQKKITFDFGARSCIRRFGGRGRIAANWIREIRRIETVLTFDGFDWWWTHTVRHTVYDRSSRERRKEDDALTKSALPNWNQQIGWGH